jgi:hypothetical protein
LATVQGPDATFFPCRPVALSILDPNQSTLAGIMARPAGGKNVSEVSFWTGGRQGFSTLLALSMRQVLRKKHTNQIFGDFSAKIHS